MPTAVMRTRPRSRSILGVSRQISAVTAPGPWAMSPFRAEVDPRAFKHVLPAQIRSLWPEGNGGRGS